MAAALSLHSRKSNISQKQNILRLCASFTRCVWSWRFKQKASLAPITLEVRFSRHWSQCFFESTLAHEHCTEAHTHNTADSPKRHWVTWYTYNSIVISLSYADDFKTAQQIACRVSECETSDYFIKLVFSKCSQCSFLSHFSNSNHKSRTARKSDCYKTRSVNVTFVNREEKSEPKQNKLQTCNCSYRSNSVSDALVCTHTPMHTQTDRETEERERERESVGCDMCLPDT